MNEVSERSFLEIGETSPKDAVELSDKSFLENKKIDKFRRI